MLKQLEREPESLEGEAIAAHDEAPSAPMPFAGTEDAPVIVIGAGPSGMRVAQEAARRGLDVVLFNAERWKPYNRVKLTPLLAGDMQIGAVYQQAAFPPGARVEQYSGHAIVDIDRAAKTVTGRRGRRWRYSKLALCMGSRPHIPAIPGVHLDGVYSFRSFDDVEKLVARSLRSRRAVVIGGGLLGLEAARGMAKRGAETWIIEHENHLMARQLDAGAGVVLAERITSLGLVVRTAARVKAITGRERVSAIELDDGTVIPTDTVIICTGIRPNMELARDVGLAVGRGITVNACMQTSDPDIYAAGECAEFESHIYGLAGPGFEQAAVAAAHMAGEVASYAGSIPATRLKVIGTDVFSMGDVDQLDQRKDVRTPVFKSMDEGVYRRLVLSMGRLAGAIAIGEWAEINQVQQAVRDRRRIWPWQVIRFRRTGRLWRERQPASVLEWPAAATVCNCTGVNRGQLGEAIALGCATYDDVKRETSASTVCGSCRPLIEELLGAQSKPEPVDWFRPVAAFSALALISALATLVVPGWPIADTVRNGFPIDRLWIDGIWKQWSGYTLLGLAVAAAVLSLRKRIRALNFGGYDGWRLVHAGIGLLAMLALFAHTGFRLGSNLNGWLMASFLAATALGALSGAVTAMEHRLLDGPLKGRRSQPRKLPVWLHILVLWPLPVLLLFHILTVYYF